MDKKILSSIMLITLTGILIIGSTLAWFTTTSDPITNEFTAGTVAIAADETVSPPPEIMENWNPGDCTEKEYTIVNSGTKSIYVRGTITGQWYDTDGVTPFTPIPDLDVVTWEMNPPGQEWTLIDNIWYYNNPIAGTYSGSAGSAILKIKVCLDGPNTDNQYQGKVFKLTAQFEAIQSSNNSVDDAWTNNPYNSNQDNPVPNPNNTPVFNMSASVKNTITFGGTSEIEGNISTNSILPNSIVFGPSSNKLIGDLYIGPGGDKNDVISVQGYGRSFSDVIFGSIYNLNTLQDFSMPVFPTNLPLHPDSSTGDISIGLWPNNTYELISDGHYSSITIQNSGTLYIDTGNTDRIIKIDSLTIGGNIELRGSGRLLLYVEEFNQVTQTSNINISKPANRLIMIVKGNNVHLGIGSTHFRGGIYAPNAFVQLLGSSRVTGSIIAKDLNIGLGNRTAVKYENVN